jgi:hypothetical protein
MKAPVTILLLFIFSFAAAQEKLSIVQQAMRDELERNMKELKTDGFEKPFFINYALQDQTATSISASLGALTRSSETKTRTAQSIRLLVGDYEFNDESLDSEMADQQQPNEINLPLDDDYMGIRRSLWISTDNVYRGASRQFARNQEALKEKNKPLSEVPHRSFAKVTPSKVDIEADPIKLDKKEIEDYVRKVSAVFNEYPELEWGSVEFEYNRGYRYLVNSEGSMNRVPFGHAVLTISAGLRTKEGKHAGDRRAFETVTPELPPIDAAIATAKDIAKRAISASNVTTEFTEEYVGPVLFEGEIAVSIVGYQLMLSEALAAMPRYRRQPLKAVDKVGKQIFPETMTVKALPKLEKYGDKLLLGSFPVDAEGVVPADETVLIENGIVKTIMTDRTVTKAGQTSNGLGFGPGVMQVSFRNAAPASTLKAKLIEQAKKEGLDYGLMIKTADLDQPGMGAVEVFKVYVADGHEEFVPTIGPGEEISERAFRKILAASTETTVANVVWINGYVSVIGPHAILMEELEIDSERPNDHEEKLETYVTSPRKK